MKNILIMTLFLTVTLLNAGQITIAVSANVSYAIHDLTKEFNKIYPDTKVQVILGSSGKLTAQIRHGAPYDIFMSANMAYPQHLYKVNLAVNTPEVYAEGALALLSLKKRNYCAEIFVLKDADIKKIAIANPKTAPYGLAAKEALEKAKLFNELKHKLVYAESISQTVSYVMMATDIGIVAKSSLYAPNMAHFKEAIHWSEIDKNLYTPIQQGIVIIKSAEANKEVKFFYDFMLSSKAEKILTRYGYNTL